MPLNLHKWRAAGSANAAEMAQVQRFAPVLPPRAYWGVTAADVREQSAENAKADLTSGALRTQR